jgi:hypothetical protein
VALALAAATAGAEVRPVEAVGAVPLDPDKPMQRPPRDAALDRALVEAVWRVAVEELPDFDADRQEEALRTALGTDPLEFATRYRILEDRGERPALFTEDPTVKAEYVVLAEVHVDADRVRERLVRARLLVTPSGDRPRWPVRVEIVELRSYASYVAVRTLLEEMGLRAPVPVEMERGRAVLQVEADRPPAQLLADLVRAATANLSLVPIGSDAESLQVRARFLGMAAE